MKAMVALVAAIVILIGFASAWDSTNYFNYQYAKIVNTQAGEHIDWLGSASSSAQFGGIGGYGSESAMMSNSLDNVQADLTPVYEITPDTHDVLTQWGSAVLGTKSPDLQNPTGAIMFGTATSGQNLELSGNFAGVVRALFDNTAVVGIGGITASTTPDASDNPSSADNLEFSAKIDTGDAIIVDANLGQSATIGFEQINAIGAVPTLSGGVQNWAYFSGTYNPEGGDIKDIYISVANEQDFSLDL